MKGRRGGGLRGGIPRDDDDDDDDEDFESALEDPSFLETIFPGAFGAYGGGSYDVPLTSKAAQEGAARLRQSFCGGPKVDGTMPLRGLSGEGLLLLRLAAEIGRLVARPFLEEEAKLLLRGRWATALNEVREKGLILSERLFGQEHLGVPRDIAPSMLPHLPPLDAEEAAERQAGTASQAQARMPFELALVVAAVWTLRPRRTQAGPLYRKDDERMRAILGQGFPLDDRLGQLGTLGMTAGTDVLQVPVEEAERLAGMTAAALSVQLTAQLFTGPRRHVLSLLMRGRPPRGFFSVEAMERAMRVGILQGACYYQDHAALRRAAQIEVAALLQGGGLELVEADKGKAMRLWRGEAPEPRGGRVHLQPSFELLVPPDVPAGALLDLARVAALTKVDQVVTLMLSRESVLRGLEGGLDIEGVLAILGRHAFAGVPQNVAASVRGWAGHGGRAHFAEGMVVVLNREAEVRALADTALRPLLSQRVTDGVYLIAPGARSVVERRLRALEVAPAEGVARLREGIGGGARGVALPAALPASDAEWLMAKVKQARERIEAPPPAAPPTPRPVAPPTPKPAAPPTPRPVEAVWSEPVRPRPPSAPLAPPSPSPSSPPGSQAGGDADPVPAGTQFSEHTPPDLELMLRRAVRLRQQLYVKISTGQGPWRLQPQRLTHRGRQICLEAFRASVNEYRIIPLEMIKQLAVI